MEQINGVYAPLIDNWKIERLNLALKQVLKEVGKHDADVLITKVEDCILYSMEIKSTEADLKTIDFLCDSLTTKILGIKSKKCFTNVIGKMKDGIDVLSFREIYVDIEE